MAAAVDVLPAYAGMILEDAYDDAVIDCAPRVCGDDPYVDKIKSLAASCSPRMRG